MDGAKKHTPGPWVVEPVNTDGDGGTLVRKYHNGSRDCIANVWGMDSYLEPDEESVANANLIAAAPDLLEALEAFVQTHEFLGHAYRPHYQQAKQAIAKARGEA